jgi:hypothetical protein
MKSKITICITIFVLFSATNLLAAETLSRKLPVYGVLKPKVISTLVAIGNGIVHKINNQLGDQVKPGTILIKVLERGGIRPYRNTINGKVGKLHITTGAAITIGMPLITVLDPNKKILEVALSPTEANLLKTGYKVTKVGEDKNFATIEKISPLVDPDHGAVTAYLKISKGSNNRIGEVLPLEVWLPEKKKCDKIVLAKDLGLYTEGWNVDFLSGDKACLLKK